ncbi:conserved hypothetical protein [Alteracholeplasma palmae J233]|uniref:Uncharacterized protein n=1 Tax=Alteracholeplasma palmae (strain ATCC 49389 / J233) TaxID=1318466 RepID=U4KLG9_ALTPJ|nr:hypothetical protein [Alteracholeplasma palmae]CCV64789.1 conserved hypothetical protein [Alteracholeplasma palmae J233]
MEKIIDDYIYAVVKNLPKDMRLDIEEELYVTIEDMLLGDYSEANIEKTLLELGRPDVLALEYKEKPDYLISPLYYNEYLLYLKFSMIVAGVFSAALACLLYLLNVSNEVIYLKILKTIGISFGSIILGFIIAFTLVTLAFAITDKVDKKNKNRWKIKDLPQRPSSEKMLISRKKSLWHIGFTMIIGIIGVTLVLFYTDKIGYAVTEGTTQVIYPVINRSIALIYIPVFFVSLALNITLTYFEIKDGVLSIKIAILDTVYKMFATVALLAFILQPQIINPEFIKQFALHSDTTINSVELAIRITLITFSVIIAILVSLSVAFKWYKVAKYK